MTGPRRRWDRVRDWLPRLAWLTLVWLLLWGTFTPLSVLGGVLVGAAVMILLPMPPAPDRLPVRPLRLLALAAYLVYDLVVSGVAVSWQTLRYGQRACGAILELPMLTSSDRVITVMASAVTLSPGTSALQIDHERGVWYVYTLGPRDRAGVERARRQVMDMQRRVLVALGSPAEIAEARSW